MDATGLTTEHMMPARPDPRRRAHGLPPGAGPTSEGTPLALDLRRLTKVYGSHRVVDDLSLIVPSGSLLGLLGPNGAGKTTLLSMATGLLRPDSGSCTVLGHDMWADPATAKQLLGVLPDGLALPERLTGREALTFIGLLRGLPPETVAGRAADLLAFLELPEDGDKLIADYSTGMRKKIGLAVALVHAPRVLVLDEPLEAVDPVSAAGIRDLLERFVTVGGTVVMSSHVMATVEQTCSHIAILDAGRIVCAGTLAAITGKASLEEAFVHAVHASGAKRRIPSWLG